MLWGGTEFFKIEALLMWDYKSTFTQLKLISKTKLEADGVVPRLIKTKRYRIAHPNSTALLPHDNRSMDHSSSLIHKQPCYVVTSCPQLESQAIYWSWKDASNVMYSSTAAAMPSSPSESTGDAKDVSVTKRRQDSSDSGQNYGRYNSIFQAIESMIGSAEYSNIIEQEAERIRKRKQSSQLAYQLPNVARTEHNKFRDNMALLRRYVEENGCLPPMSRAYSLTGGQPASSLHRFMMQMRQEIRKYHSDPSTSSLITEQYDELVSIGFVHELNRRDAFDQKPPGKRQRNSANSRDSSVGHSNSKFTSWTSNKLQKWNEMLARVQSFHTEHKRLPCRQDDENLYRWIQKQKQRVLDSIATETGSNESSCNKTSSSQTVNGHTNNFPIVQEASPIISRRPPQLSTEQVVKLATVGVSFTPPAQKLQIEARCQEWVTYRQQHGQNPPSKSSLGIWASHIISKYRNWKLGKQKRCNLTPALLDQLTKAGFVFPTDQEIEAFRKQQVEHVQKPKLTWDDMFGMLQKWKEEHGHLSVPRNEPKLGNWTHSQRKEYNKLKRGEKSTMSPERLKKLLSIGFTFSNTNWRKDRGLLVMDDDDGPKHENPTGFGIGPV